MPQGLGILEGFGLREDVATGVAPAPTPTPLPDNIADGCPYHLYIGDKPLWWLQCGMWYQYLPGQLHADETLLYYSDDSDIPITAERLPGLLHSDGKIWFFGDVPLTSEADMPETLTTSFDRGVTTKSDGSTLNLGSGGDSFTLPEEWRLMKRVAFTYESTWTDFNGVTTTSIALGAIHITELLAADLGDRDLNFILNLNMQVVFNPRTGTFPAHSRNDDIDKIFLIGEAE